MRAAPVALRHLRPPFPTRRSSDLRPGGRRDRADGHPGGLHQPPRPARRGVRSCRAAADGQLPASIQPSGAGASSRRVARGDRRPPRRPPGPPEHRRRPRGAVMTDTTLLILGASGDLTRRLLLPGIGSLLEREPDRPVRIVGADRAQLSAADFADRLGEALAEGGAGSEVVARLRDSATYYPIDVTEAADLGPVLQELSDTGRLVLYFALPPAVTERACRAMVGMELAENVHLAMEKPFGHDEASARELNRLVARIVPDERVHRVDHFLGKSSVLDIMALRFANRMLQA